MCEGFLTTLYFRLILQIRLYHGFILDTLSLLIEILDFFACFRTLRGTLVSRDIPISIFLMYPGCFL